MSKFWIVFFHTYTSKLKSKTFIITTIITALLLLGLSNIQNIIDFFNKSDQGKTVAVISTTTDLYTAFDQQIKTVNHDIKVEQYSGSEEKIQKKVLADKYEGYLLLSLNNEQLPQAIYKAKSLTDTTINQSLQQALQQLKTSIATNQAGLSTDQIKKLYEPVQFSQIALEKNAKTEEELNQSRGLVYILIFFIYMTVMMYANMIAMEVATEKSSRVMEILVSSASPIQQMFGKILGVALVSITQLVILLGIGYVSIQNNLKGLKSSDIFSYFGLNHIPVGTICYGIVFFLLGYLLYSTMAAVLGSLVSKIEDVQQTITPMMFLVIAAFMIAMFGLTKPEAGFITVTSFIPFFAPMIMFLRVGMLTIPLWQISLSIGLLILTIILLAIFGAKVYKGGVLLYGKASSFKDIKKALLLLKK